MIKINYNKINNRSVALGNRVLKYRVYKSIYKKELDYIGTIVNKARPYWNIINNMHKEKGLVYLKVSNDTYYKILNAFNKVENKLNKIENKIIKINETVKAIQNEHAE